MDYAPCDRPVRVRAASEFAGPRPQHPWTTSTSSSSLHFIQIGSHLGAFPLMAATYGCRVLAVEAYAEHTRYIDATGCVNGMSNLRVVHRAIDSVSDRELWFDEHYAQIIDDRNPRMGATSSDVALKSVLTAGRTDAPEHHGKRMVLTASIDDLVRQFVLGPDAFGAGAAALNPHQPTIQTVVLDVEGFEQQALAGAKNLIASRQVLFWQVEVWLVLGGTVLWTDVERYVGLHSLVAAGYQLYTVDIDGHDPYIPLSSVADMLRQMGVWCKVRKECASEVLAVHPDHADSWQAVWKRRQKLYP